MKSYEKRLKEFGKKPWKKRCGGIQNCSLNPWKDVTPESQVVLENINISTEFRSQEVIVSFYSALVIRIVDPVLGTSIQKRERQIGGMKITKGLEIKSMTTGKGFGYG